MTLSVIVPVYNMAADDKLKWCMDSLIGQTLPAESFEVIAVDDCSTDASYDILKDYEERYPGHVRVFRTPRNLHQGGAKNLGLMHAKGDWIGFLDADDYLAPAFYERLLKAADEEGADMAGCDYCLVDRHTWEVGKHVPNNTAEQAGELDEEKYRKLLPDTGSLAVKIYRRHIIYGGPGDGAYHRIFPEDIFYEDNAVSNTWMLRAKRFAYIPEPLYYYLQHEGSTVHTITRKRLEDRMTAGRLLLEEAREGGYLDTYHDEIEFEFTVLFYINTLFSAMPSRTVMKGKYAFCKKLGEEMKRTFPGFTDNPYYLSRIHPEERKLIGMQMRSHLMFYVYYRLLWFYRGLRGKGAQGV